MRVYVGLGTTEAVIARSWNRASLKAWDRSYIFQKKSVTTDE